MTHGHADLRQPLDQVARGVEAGDGRLLMPVHGERAVRVVLGPERSGKARAGAHAQGGIERVKAMAMALAGPGNEVSPSIASSAIGASISPMPASARVARSSSARSQGSRSVSTVRSEV